MKEGRTDLPVVHVYAVMDLRQVKQQNLRVFYTREL